jgi:hypothetical protein
MTGSDVKRLGRLRLGGGDVGAITMLAPLTAVTLITIRMKIKESTYKFFFLSPSGQLGCGLCETVPPLSPTSSWDGA